MLSCSSTTCPTIQRPGAPIRGPALYNQTTAAPVSLVSVRLCSRQSRMRRETCIVGIITLLCVCLPSAQCRIDQQRIGHAHSPARQWIHNIRKLFHELTDLAHNVGKPIKHGVNYFEKEITKLSKFGVNYCSACTMATTLVRKLLQEGESEKHIISMLKTSCKLFRISTDRVCSGIVDQFKGEFFYVMQRSKLSSKEICDTVFPEDCGPNKDPALNWTVQLPSRPKPPVKPSPPPSAGARTLRVLHLSDTHVDHRYTIGSWADCKEPLCCHSDNGLPGANGVPAGRWGYFKYCDIPMRTYESLLRHVSKKQKIDYVIWTGDMVPHDIWNVSRTDNLAIMKETAEMIARYLPGVPVFPALGNHEGVPVDSFPLPMVKGNQSISWLYDALVKQWSLWLPSSTTFTLRRGAYYSIRPFPGLKIISLNMNYCNSLNWWILLNTTDPTSELAWLTEELQASEILDEKVHIIGHIPPGGSDCLTVWSHNYYKIIARFESTVRGQFFGHTHMDEIEVFYHSPRNYTGPFSVAYLSPSATTYNTGNPAYRIFTVDGGTRNSTWTVLDHETYTMDLAHANEHPDIEPDWTLEYSAKSAFGLSSLDASQWDRLLRKMEHNDALFNKFYRFFYKFSPLAEPCDEKCRRKLICIQKTSRSSDQRFCK
ncbi:sphingomyelin phosphodiesterase-like [Ornithodoros turicata]|uniref:sphingomyelin phosphodiesterase-like n=1 Tax=Ornithodoros turicata TaxID=34597 RepID=UPI0031393116